MRSRWLTCSGGGIAIAGARLIYLSSGEVNIGGQCLVNAVVSMGRRNTKLEPAWHGKQMLKSLAGVRADGMLPWLGFDSVQPNRWLSRGSSVESMRWMVLHRPVEPASVTGHLKSDFICPVTRLTAC